MWDGERWEGWSLIFCLWSLKQWQRGKLRSCTISNGVDPWTFISEGVVRWSLNSEIFELWNGWFVLLHQHYWEADLWTQSLSQWWNFISSDRKWKMLLFTVNSWQKLNIFVKWIDKFQKPLLRARQSVIDRRMHEEDADIWRGSRYCSYLIVQFSFLSAAINRAKKWIGDIFKQWNGLAEF